jgi:Kef-type K+ transport system membrane component KefB
LSEATHLIWIGAAMLVALAAHEVGRRVHLPRVTILLVLGALAGPELFDLLPAQANDSFGLITQVTLAMVGFLLGERISFSDLGKAREALIISIAVTLLTGLLVGLAVWLLTGSLAAALLLGAISTATDAAATLDVLKESGGRGPLTQLVYQVVAIDDAWCAILFSIALVAVELIVGTDGANWLAMGHGVVEVLGSIALGVVAGLPMAWLTGRLTPGEPLVLESLGFVLLAAGLAHLLDLSYLLTCMTLGVVVANRAKHHLRPFRSVEGIAHPLLALFFFMAGYQLEWSALPAIGWLGLVYVLSRIAGRLLGGRLGGWMASSSHSTRRRIGASLMPQAGVALGLVLVATEKFPDLAYLLPLVIGATVLFELTGPPLTLRQLRKARETERDRAEQA